jgi:signal peptidase I
MQEAAATDETDEPGSLAQRLREARLRRGAQPERPSRDGALGAAMPPEQVRDLRRVGELPDRPRSHVDPSGVASRVQPRLPSTPDTPGLAAHSVPEPQPTLRPRRPLTPEPDPQTEPSASREPEPEPEFELPRETEPARPERLAGGTDGGDTQATDTQATDAQPTDTQATDAPPTDTQPAPGQPGGVRPGADLARRLAEANAAVRATTRRQTPIPDEPDDEADMAPPRPPLAAVVSERLRPVGARIASGWSDAVARARDAASRKRAPSPRTAGRPPSTGWLRFAVVLFVAVLVAIGLRSFVVAPYFIPSASMETTLHGCDKCNNDHVLVNKLAYHLHSIHRGDVVVFHRPSTWSVTESLLIKRVIGLPGDRITATQGVVFVNGGSLIEPYIDKACTKGTTDLTPFTVPKGDVFVMGDNRCDSEDSRNFGPVPESKIVGRAFVIIWPLGRVHWL